MSPISWFLLILELAIVGIAIAKTHTPRSETELSPKAARLLREMEDRQFIVRAKAQREAK